MAKKTKAEQTRHDHDAVYTGWMSRPPERRRSADTDAYADELWSCGPRMGYSQELHRQHVMDVIRGHVVRG